jgi:hypothetical protein
MSKLGPHVILLTEEVRPWVERAPIVKALDDPTPLLIARGARVLVFRAYFENQDIPPETAAGVVIERLGSFRDARLYVEGLNEIHQYMWSGFADYVAWTRRFAEICHQAGLKVAGFSFSTGTPRLDTDPGGAEEWLYLKSQDYAGVDAIAIHEYWGNWGFTGWNALRYRKVHDILGPDHPPFIITECGRDAVDDGRGGWQLDNISAEQYAQELLAYDAEISRDPYVLGATVFTTRSMDQRWNPFTIEPVVPYLLNALGSSDGGERSDSPLPGPAVDGGEAKMSLKDQFPQLWQAWVEAGGDETHFFAFLVGVNALPPTRDNLLKVVEALEGDLNGLKEALKRLPLS